MKQVVDGDDVDDNKLLSSSYLQLFGWFSTSLVPRTSKKKGEDEDEDEEKRREEKKGEDEEDVKKQKGEVEVVN